MAMREYWEKVVVAVPFGGESGVAQQALGEQLLVAVVTSSSSESMRARFSWQLEIGLGRSGGIGGDLGLQIAQTNYALFRHAGASFRNRKRRLVLVCNGECVLVVNNMKCRS